MMGGPSLLLLILIYPVLVVPRCSCASRTHAYTRGGSWAVVQRFNPFLMEYLSRWRGGYKDDNDGRGSSSGAPL